jgi:hypothetical protein
VASAALVLRTHRFLFPRYRRVVCFTWLQTQGAHAADTTPVLQHPKNQHRLAEHGIFSKEELPCKSRRASPTTGCSQQALKNA